MNTELPGIAIAATLAAAVLTAPAQAVSPAATPPAYRSVFADYLRYNAPQPNKWVDSNAAVGPLRESPAADENTPPVVEDASSVEHPRGDEPTATGSSHHHHGGH